MDALGCHNFICSTRFSLYAVLTLPFRRSYRMASASRLPAALQPTEADISLLLAAQAHIGAKQVEKKMAPYVWKRRQDGVK